MLVKLIPTKNNQKKLWYKPCQQSSNYKQYSDFFLTIGRSRFSSLGFRVMAQGEDWCSGIGIRDLVQIQGICGSNRVYSSRWKSGIYLNFWLNKLIESTNPSWVNFTKTLKCWLKCYQLSLTYKWSYFYNFSRHLANILYLRHGVSYILHTWKCGSFLHIIQSEHLYYGLNRTLI